MDTALETPSKQSTAAAAKSPRGMILFLLACVVVWIMGLLYSNEMADSRTFYIGTQCLLRHQNPWNQQQMIQAFNEAATITGSPTWKTQDSLIGLTLFVYIPNSCLFMAPLAMLPWSAASLLLMALMCNSLILSAFLAARARLVDAPALCFPVSAALLLVSCFVPAVGNIAALVVGMCVFAVYAILQNKWAFCSVLALAVALLLKPQDAGMIWLFFLLAGGIYRKRALQSLLCCVLLSLPGVLWANHVVPTWRAELAHNVAIADAHGGQSDPRPDSIANTGIVITSLQTVVSFFVREPRIYNAISLLICAPLFALWAYTTVRGKMTVERAWLGLAAIVPLSVLPVYHRTYDAKLIFLLVPACAILWKQGGRQSRIAVGLLVATAVLDMELPWYLQWVQADFSPAALSTFGGKILTIAIARHAALCLLLTGGYFLWIYVRHSNRELQLAHAVEGVA